MAQRRISRQALCGDVTGHREWRKTRPDSGFLQRLRMDDVQERELRQWGEALAESSDSERRAMGKAIVMLLDQIESLKTSLAEAQPQPFALPEVTVPVSQDAVDEDTATINLRDRLRAATNRLRD